MNERNLSKKRKLTAGDIKEIAGWINPYRTHLADLIHDLELERAEIERLRKQNMEYARYVFDSWPICFRKGETEATDDIPNCGECDWCNALATLEQGETQAALEEPS